ncbi:hypothetical protein VTJ04DRAFT_2558 [Mycothermus thermophilus]|uniref:uncharacterized protein n=1 Tax=Humicola insolens TaxID=85995 RepID=UPI0037445DF1
MPVTLGFSRSFPCDPRQFAEQANTSLCKRSALLPSLVHLLSATAATPRLLFLDFHLFVKFPRNPCISLQTLRRSSVSHSRTGPNNQPIITSIASFSSISLTIEIHVFSPLHTTKQSEKTSSRAPFDKKPEAGSRNRASSPQNYTILEGIILGRAGFGKHFRSWQKDKGAESSRPLKIIPCSCPTRLTAQSGILLLSSLSAGQALYLGFYVVALGFGMTSIQT